MALAVVLLNLISQLIVFVALEIPKKNAHRLFTFAIQKKMKIKIFYDHHKLNKQIASMRNDNENCWCLCLFVVFM